MVPGLAADGKPSMLCADTARRESQLRRREARSRCRLLTVNDCESAGTTTSVPDSVCNQLFCYTRQDEQQLASLGGASW